MSVAESSMLEDEGGYWLSTNKSQNEVVVRRASMSRPSILQIQQSHSAELQAMQERFPTTATHDLVRFLKARDYNVGKAISMYEDHVHWRETTLPNIANQTAAIQATLATRKFYMLDECDAEGRPVILYCLHRFKEMDYIVEEEIAALVYLLEHHVIPRFGPSFDTQQFVVLLDVSGIRSPPLKFLQKVNAVMEANYPETLFRSVMFPVPNWLQKIIQGFLVFVAEETRNKFAYVNDVQSLEEFAGMSLEQMGPDLADLVKTKKLRK